MSCSLSSKTTKISATLFSGTKSLKTALKMYFKEEQNEEKLVSKWLLQYKITKLQNYKITLLA